MTNVVVNNAAAQLLQAENVEFNLKREVARIQNISAADWVLEEEGHRRAYLRIREMFRFFLEVHNNKDLDAAWNDERRKRQVRPSVGSQNICYPFTSVLDGRVVPGKTVAAFEGMKNLPKWEHNRSSEKFAKVLRHLFEMGIKVEDVVDYINNYVHPNDKSKTKILGIMKADSEAHPTGPRQTSWTGSVKQDALKARGLGKIPSSVAERLTAHDGFALALVRIADGVVLCDGMATPDSVIRIVTGQKDVWSKNGTYPVRENTSVEFQSSHEGTSA